MSIDRTPETLAGVSVIGAIGAQFAADPLGTAVAIAGLIAAVLSVVGNLVRLVRNLRK
jgi:hypothetical protein